MNDETVLQLENKIYEGYEITKEDALKLVDSDLTELANAADRIRQHFCSNEFDMCTIINAKSGKCSENCKFCAQSAFYNTENENYPFLDSDAIFEQAKYNAERGVLRFSLVTSGRALSKEDIDKACAAIKRIKEKLKLHVCVSVGLLDKEGYSKLREAGADRVHNNLEASENFFKSVCTTHTHEDKINSIKAAKEAGLSVCSGGIIGLGESMEDRIDMALSIRELDVKSIPVNVLSPIKGTPFENNELLSIDEIRRVVAIFRFINPASNIRLAGGRGRLENNGEILFKSGANAAITGDMLTTLGYSIDSDRKMLESIGYHITEYKY